MALERTLSIIKPDATERNITGIINKMIEDAGMRIVAQKRIQLSQAQAEKFYAVHKERSFFGELVESMIEGPVVVQVLEAENCVAKYRELMGATNPSAADEGTIRKAVALDIGRNSVHGSDSVENARREVTFFFSESEIVG
jgi:nucleoside-diphosphate kinase